MKKIIIKLFVFLIVGFVAYSCAKSIVVSAKQEAAAAILKANNEYKAKMQAQYEEARNQLAIEVDRYIVSVAPKAKIDPFLMIDLCWQYDVDIRFVLAQGQVESHFATKGTAAKTKSIFNVGAYDGHSASRQKRNGFGYTNPNESIEPYLKLITNDYLINGKTERDLMRNYVNGLGQRYASNPRYERMLRSVYNRICDHTDFCDAYDKYLLSQYNLKNC